MTILVSKGRMEIDAGSGISKRLSFDRLKEAAKASDTWRTESERQVAAEPRKLMTFSFPETNKTALRVLVAKWFAMATLEAQTTSLEFSRARPDEPGEIQTVNNVLIL